MNEVNFRIGRNIKWIGWGFSILFSLSFSPLLNRLILWMLGIDCVSIGRQKADVQIICDFQKSILCADAYAAQTLSS